jgi:UDP-N-acetyl-2-amino-2-deoxyglucuronate dehydrogenase
MPSAKVIEKETGKRIYTVLQVRLHPAIKALREAIKKDPAGKTYDLDLTYITSRGNWYHQSWKGNISKSGGIATNIGIHFFDLLIWIFGKVSDNRVHVLQPDRAAGFLHLEKARIRWFLSLDYDDLPARLKKKGIRTYRSLTMNGEEIEFSEGFTDLHTEIYRDILRGKGFGLADAKPSVETVFKIRNAHPVGLRGDYHPFLRHVNV